MQARVCGQSGLFFSQKDQAHQAEGSQVSEGFGQNKHYISEVDLEVIEEANQLEGRAPNKNYPQLVLPKFVRGFASPAQN